MVKFETWSSFSFCSIFLSVHVSLLPKSTRCGLQFSVKILNPNIFSRLIRRGSSPPPFREQNGRIHTKFRRLLVRARHFINKSRKTRIKLPTLFASECTIFRRNKWETHTNRKKKKKKMRKSRIGWKKENFIIFAYVLSSLLGSTITVVVCFFWHMSSLVEVKAFANLFGARTS